MSGDVKVEKLAIFCAGNLGKEIYDIAKRINKINLKWVEIFFVDNYAKEGPFYGTKVCRFADYADIINIEYVIANGEPAQREKIYQQLKESNCKACLR
jgi:hypothetical protein